MIDDLVDTNQKQITILAKRRVGFKNCVTNVLYLSRLKPWVAKAEMSVSALNGIAMANTIRTDVNKGGSFKIWVTIYPEEMINPTMITSEKTAVIFNAEAITF